MDLRRKFLQSEEDSQREIKLEKPDKKHTETEKLITHQTILPEKTISNDEEAPMEGHIFFMSKMLDRYSERCNELKIYFETLKKETSEKLLTFENQLEEQKKGESKSDKKLLELEEQVKVLKESSLKKDEEIKKVEKKNQELSKNVDRLRSELGSKIVGSNKSECESRQILESKFQSRIDKLLEEIKNIKKDLSQYKADAYGSISLPKTQNFENLDSRILVLENYKSQIESESNNEPNKDADLKNFIKKSLKEFQEAQAQEISNMATKIEKKLETRANQIEQYFFSQLESHFSRFIFK